MLTTTERLTQFLPLAMRRRVEPVLDAISMMREAHNPNTLATMVPSTFRGFVLREGRADRPTHMVSAHSAYFDWTYKSDFPEMRELYRRAKQNQWDQEVVLDWSIDVDPMNPEVPLLPDSFFPLDFTNGKFELTPAEQRRFIHSMSSWMLSQFLHGEQGALYAAAQVTESVQWMDGKLYGASQVLDEGRHVETFHRYLDEKLNKLYVVNDNLFTIIDALMTDSRWDMKFLGMQIMVEGLALGAFGMMYKVTKEPLLKNLLRYIIQDEARHVHYGVLALRKHFIHEISEQERREREDWAFEVALLMRNRFRAHEVYEEWFEGTISRPEWNRLVDSAPGMREFRTVMFSRLIPNLREIGLLSDRVMGHYERAGLTQYMHGLDATRISGDGMLRELDGGAAASEDDIPAELRELQASAAE
jgi:hypothetical protein